MCEPCCVSLFWQHTGILVGESLPGRKSGVENFFEVRCPLMTSIDSVHCEVGSFLWAKTPPKVWKMAGEPLSMRVRQWWTIMGVCFPPAAGAVSAISAGMSEGERFTEGSCVGSSWDGRAGKGRGGSATGENNSTCAEADAPLVHQSQRLQARWCFVKRHFTTNIVMGGA
jgi:hypothetical protein